MAAEEVPSFPRSSVGMQPVTLQRHVKHVLGRFVEFESVFYGRDVGGWLVCLGNWEIGRMSEKG